MTTTPQDAYPRKAAWLFRDHASTVLPAVSSLKALRAAAGGAQGVEALSRPRSRLHLRTGPRAARVVLGGQLGCCGELITGAMRKLAANEAMGRAEAMRQSMLARIDKWEPQEAHPAYWAPFVVVGEGGTRK